MSGKIFFGLFVIFFGVSIIVNHVFKIDFPWFKMLLGLFIIYFGFTILLGGFGVNINIKNDKNTVFSNQNLNPIRLKTNEEYSTVFGETIVDLSTTDFTEGQNIALNAVFGKIELILPADVNVKLKSDVVGGAIENNRINPSSSDTTKSLAINASVVFGSIKIR